MAVKISNGVKSFKERFTCTKKSKYVEVLQKFNLNVPARSLYSLLGSSGCGKTTVISVIMGLCKLDTGKLEVTPSSRALGYMPQETCLYSEFSIYETLQFFGTLFGISEEHNNKSEFLKCRINYLRNLLQLPAQERIVGTLSGGQKRRLSLAIALIHEPEILLLDEPTAGVDPLVREMIWNHLSELVETKGTTIMLTTHYVEEAKGSTIVGFMRNGNLIAENTPSNLLEIHNVNLMEAVFLALCQKQNFQRVNLSSATNNTESSMPFQEVDGVQKRTDMNISCSLRRIYALVGKNYKCLFRNVSMLVLISIIPALCMLGTCIGMNDDPNNIALGVINYDVEGRTDNSDDNGCFKSYTLKDSCLVEKLSCAFLESLTGNTVKLINYKTVEVATQAVEKGNVWGYIYFSTNYTNALSNRVLMGSSSYYDESQAAKAEWNDSKILVRLDQTNTIIYGKLMTTLHQAFENSSKTMLKNCGYNERIGEYPLQYADPIVGEDKKLTVLNYVAPSLAIELIYFFSLTTAIRFISEKRDGTLERCIAGGAQNWEILISYGIAQSSVILIQSILLIIVLHFGFSLVSYVSKLPLVVVLLYLQGLSGLAVGLLLAIFCTEESQASLGTIGIVLPHLFVSGLLWPLEGLPKLMQDISPYLPLTLSGESIRSLMIRGWDFNHPNVWQGFLITVGYLLVWSILILVLIGKQLLK